MADESTNAAAVTGSQSPGTLPLVMPSRPGVGQGKNRRRHERTEFTAKVSLHELDSDHGPGEAQIAEAVDLSRSGIGLRTRRMFYVDTRVVIVIELKGQRTFKCGVVRFSKYASAGWHHCGVEFTVIPSSSRLQLWIQQRCG